MASTMDEESKIGEGTSIGTLEASSSSITFAAGGVERSLSSSSPLCMDESWFVEYFCPFDNNGLADWVKDDDVEDDDNADEKGVIVNAFVDVGAKMAMHKSKRSALVPTCRLCNSIDFVMVLIYWCRAILQIENNE